MDLAWRVIGMLALVAGLIVFVPVAPVAAAGVVGTGTSGSCTEAALDAALAGGGSVSFNCGYGSTTIPITSEKIIAANTQINGQNRIVLDGQNQTRIFRVNPGIALELERITLTRGNAGDGGAIFNDEGDLTITHSTLTDNVASGVSGGAIYNEEGNATITDSTATGNSSSVVGGVIFSDGGYAEIVRSTFTNNSTGNNGGAVNAGDLVILDSTISDNLATGPAGSGGGIFTYGDATITNSTVSGNYSGDEGGGIHAARGSLVVTNSTISSNESFGRGGGVASNSAALTFSSSTLYGNAAGSTGSGISGGTTTIQNSIVANGIGAANCEGNPVTSLGGNLSDDASCNLNQPSDLNNTPADLGPLGDFGGPTQTHRPEEGSAAIDNAVRSACPRADQRGVTRSQGPGCDIGSVEVVVPIELTTICSNYYTGQLSASLTGNCGPSEFAISLPSPYPLSFCINHWTGQLTYATRGTCTAGRTLHVVPDDGDLLVCYSYYTSSVTYARAPWECAYPSAQTALIQAIR